MPSPDTASAELLAALSKALDALGADWYLFGAQAVTIWGRPRLTADVDVTVRLDPADPERLVAALVAVGFRLRFPDVDEFVRRTHVLPFVYLPNGLPLDLVVAGPGLEELFLSRAIQVDLAGIRIPVISPEDLVAAKVLAGRAKDLDDAASVLAERADRFDPDGVRQTLFQLQEALGQSDLLPLFEQLLSRALGDRR